MKTTRIIRALALPALAIALVLAGCGGDGDSGGAYGGNGAGATSTSSSEKPSPSGAESGAAALKVAGAAGVGPVLVDAEGFTVYDFHKDRGGVSSCYGGCAGVWPPVVTAGAPRAGQGATASALGTTKRRDGTTQVTYAGHPLYTYAADRKPGEANGHDIESYGAEWYALRGNGEEAED